MSCWSPSAARSCASCIALLREREMEKRYLALVVGRWPFGEKTIDLPLKTNLKQGGERVVRVHADGQHAVTTFKPLQHFGKLATLLDISIGTGRTHQIRVHAAHAGHPIAGDEKYGDRERDAQAEALRPAAHVPARALADVPARRAGDRSASRAVCRRELQALLEQLASSAKER